MSTNWLADCLENVKHARIAILGEFCLDSYWFISEAADELSVETGLAVRRVKEQRYSLGGAANVAANLRALNVAKISALGVIGRDPFGDTLVHQLSKIDVDTTYIVRNQTDWQTCVYAKPYIDGVEQNRIDFGSFNTPSPETLDRLSEFLNEAADSHDLLIVNQQILNGLIRKPIIDAINRLAVERPDVKIIVDSRHFASDFHNVSLKINADEAVRVFFGEDTRAPVTSARASQVAQEALARMRRPVFITCGERGIVVASDAGVEEIPGIQVAPPIDVVGAGDTVLGAIASVMAVESGRDVPARAARLANIAATVSLKKLHETGTASPQEILAVGPNPNYRL